MRSFFWSVFFCIWTEYWDLLRKSPYSGQIQENTDHKKLRIFALFGQCLRIQYHYFDSRQENLQKKTKKKHCLKDWNGFRGLNITFKQFSLSYFFFTLAYKNLLKSPLDTWPKLNIHKTFTCQWRLLNVLWTFNLRSISSWMGSAKWLSSKKKLENCPGKQPESFYSKAESSHCFGKLGHLFCRDNSVLITTQTVNFRIS